LACVIWKQNIWTMLPKCTFGMPHYTINVISIVSTINESIQLYISWTLQEQYNEKIRHCLIHALREYLSLVSIQNDVTSALTSGSYDILNRCQRYVYSSPVLSTMYYISHVDKPPILYADMIDSDPINIIGTQCIPWYDNSCRCYIILVFNICK